MAIQYLKGQNAMYRILIVEDDRGIAEAIKNLVEMWDLQAMCARNFRNLMADFARYDPHLVLSILPLAFVLVMKSIF